MPSMDNTVAFGSNSVIACKACAMHSHPARVKAHWKGAVAAFTASPNCCAIVLAGHNASNTPIAFSECSESHQSDRLDCCFRRHGLRQLFSTTRECAQTSSLMDQQRPSPYGHSGETWLCPIRKGFAGFFKELIGNRLPWSWRTTNWIQLLQRLICARGQKKSAASNAARPADTTDMLSFSDSESGRNPMKPSSSDNGCPSLSQRNHWDPAACA